MRYSSAMADAPLPNQTPPIKVFRRLNIEIDGGEGMGIVTVDVPFDLLLLERFEDALHKCEDIGWKWIRFKRSDKTVLKAFREFCGHYLPATIDVEKAQPDFCAVFFSRVKVELIDSMSVSMTSILSTAGS